MKDKKNAADSSMPFVHNMGAPAELVSDHTAAEFIGPKSKFAEKARFLNVKQLSYEPHT